ncbi:colipase-like [Uloborus diversus]|uniref:colipase-like n=1 Tax=Uloborus diversus TaxID=327109 RepID=UPI0024095CD7|nr:colipase-like [Uloborus diversus]
MRVYFALLALSLLAVTEAQVAQMFCNECTDDQCCVRLMTAGVCRDKGKEGDACRGDTLYANMMMCPCGAGLRCGDDKTCVPMDGSTDSNGGSSESQQ